ncbi:hypothetical protein KW794_03085 [Candidatus Saccharibacteria bacterium]|nr:hypothetical protein [Candidatus Saccharibacteria bacterium]
MVKKWKKGKMGGGNGDMVWFLGMIGAAVYFLHTTTGIWPSIVALLKALVWPAFLVYHLLGL